MEILVKRLEIWMLFLLRGRLYIWGFESVAKLSC